MQAESGADEVLIWDWPLRACHWLLVLCVSGSWATHYAGLEWFTWHQWFGCAALVLVAFRIAWGFVGPRYARFESFVRGPRGILRYLRGDEPALPGHNPLGALSVLAFLGALLLQAGTGLFANDEIASAGPLFGWVAQETSNRLANVHATTSKVLLGLIALHLAAVAWHDLVRGRHLVRSMLNGRKRGPAVPVTSGIASALAVRALAIVIALAAALAWVISAAPDAAISVLF
jgi:cytochrome b